MSDRQADEKLDGEIMGQAALGGVPSGFMPSNEELIETTKFGKTIDKLRKGLLREKYNPKTGKFEVIKEGKEALFNETGINANMDSLRFIANQIVSLTSLRESKMYELFEDYIDELVINNWQHWKEYGISPKNFGIISSALRSLVMSILTHPVSNTPMNDKEFLKNTTDERKIKLERVGEQGRGGFSLPSLGFRR